MHVLTLLGLFHMAVSDDYILLLGTAVIPDYDEDDPFFENDGEPEEISPFELKRLPRQSDGIVKDHIIHGGQVLGTKLPIVGIERNFLKAGFDDAIKNKVQRVSRELELHTDKKVGDSMGIRNPFLGNKKNFGDSNFVRSPTSLVDINTNLKVIATPYTRSNWEPNFLRTSVK